MVSLRAKKRANGRYHLYADIYENGKRRKQYLKLYTSQDYTEKTRKDFQDSTGEIIIKRRNIRKEDKADWELAVKIVTELRNDLNKGAYNFDYELKKKRDFTKYFSVFVEKYNRADKRVAKAALKQFIEFNQGKEITAVAIDEDYATDFAKYLKARLNHETPYNYFKVFKQVVKKAYKDKILTANVAEDVKIKKVNGMAKDVLSITELRKLYDTPIKNEELRRAFLFSCLTGLDFNDVKYHFKWCNVKQIEDGVFIEGKRGKTGKDYAIRLNTDAIELLGYRRAFNDMVFNLPSSTAVRHSLKKWMEKAGINKHITYHCARHTLGTNLIFYGADMNVTSKIMTHSKLQETERYVRLAKAMKERSLDLLPQISNKDFKNRPIDIKSDAISSPSIAIPNSLPVSP